MVTHIVEWTSADPLFLLWPQSFKMLVHYYKQWSSISLNKVMAVRYILYLDLSGYTFVRGTDITLWFVLVTRTCFFRKVLNSRFVQIFSNWCFSYDSDKIWTQNSLILRQKPNFFGHTCLSSITIIHICAGFCSAVPSRVSKPVVDGFLLNNSVADVFPQHNI